MSPDVLRSKLTLLRKVLLDLQPSVSADRKTQEERHYAVERQVQLSVDLSAAIARRLLILKGLAVPETTREVFLEIGKQGLIPDKTASKLASATGLRNLLVHEYGVVDYDLFFGGLKDGYRAFVDFAASIESFLQKP